MSIAYRSVIRPPRGIMASIPTPLDATAGAVEAAWAQVGTLLHGEHLCGHMESPDVIALPATLDLIATNNLRVFPQFSYNETVAQWHTLDAATLSPQFVTAIDAFRPVYVNIAVEWNDKSDWITRNKLALRKAISAAQQAHQFQYGMSIQYESAMSAGNLRACIRMCREFDCHCIMISTYPQIGNDTRCCPTREYFDAIVNESFGLPLIVAEFGWHTRHATGQSDQAQFISMMADMVNDGTFTIANMFFTNDANGIPFPFTYFHDMGVYDSSGTPKLAAPIFADAVSINNARIR